MPLENRVTPFGEIVAIPERGTLMGNRGILHDAHRQVRRRWAGRAWISCLLEFRGQRGPVMAPGHYTRLFFLDEPTAFAAGHRPCAYCRRADYVRFRDTWASANPQLGLGVRPRAAEIDRVLHAERLGQAREVNWVYPLAAALPDGVMVTEPSNGDDRAYLVWRGGLWRWSPSGYTSTEIGQAGPALALTPPSVIATLAAGYQTLPPALSGRPRST
jgi:hypothetical protein